MDKNNTDNLVSIDFKNRKETKFISGRIATESDVKNGFAVFYINNAKNHKACDVDLPTLAQLIDYDEVNDDLHEVVVVIQWEFLEDGYGDPYEVVGYKKFNGETGECLPYDLNFLSDSEIEEFNQIARA